VRISVEQEGILVEQEGISFEQEGVLVANHYGIDKE